MLITSRLREWISHSLTTRRRADARRVRRNRATQAREIRRIERFEERTLLAATVSVVGGDLVVEDSGDTDNVFTVSFSPSSGASPTHIIVQDSSATLTTSISGATGDGTNSVSVPFTSFSGDILIRAGSGDDTATVNLHEALFPRLLFDGGGQSNSLIVNGLDADEVLTVDVDEFNTLTDAGDAVRVWHFGNAQTDGLVEGFRVGSLTLNVHGGNDRVDVSDLSVYGSGNGVRLSELTIDLGDGDDTLEGTLANHSIHGLGGIGNDSLTGSDFDDTLEGGDGNDTLLGRFGRDSLIGGSGMDSLDGGTNEDYLQVDGTDTSVAGGSEADIVEFAQDVTSVTFGGVVATEFLSVRAASRLRGSRRRLRPDPRDSRERDGESQQRHADAQLVRASRAVQPVHADRSGT